MNHKPLRRLIRVHFAASGIRRMDFPLVRLTQDQGALLWDDKRDRRKVGVMGVVGARSELVNDCGHLWKYMIKIAIETIAVQITQDSAVFNISLPPWCLPPVEMVIESNASQADDAEED